MRVVFNVGFPSAAFEEFHHVPMKAAVCPVQLLVELNQCVGEVGHG